MAANEQAYWKDLGGSLLADVSRSFYLTLSRLPSGIREPVALGYLLARATDTLADLGNIPKAERTEFLQEVVEMVHNGAETHRHQRLLREVLPFLGEGPESALLRRLPHCVTWLESLEPYDRADVLWVFDQITTGQLLDIRRFGEPVPGELIALGDPEFLDQYTYLVAGSVGDFWTRICYRHDREFSKLTREEMTGWGVRYGKGLQLVNILRDIPSDMQQGRLYIPMDPSTFTEPFHWELQRAMAPWIERAEQYLDSGWAYVRSIHRGRLRLATALPLLLGYRTLKLICNSPWEQWMDGVKVARREVQMLVLSAAAANRSSWALEKLMANARAS